MLRQASYGGELAAEAILDALTGALNPAGRLPVTMYYPNITMRDSRNFNLSDDGGITHQFFAGPVLRPFGFGLSYTTGGLGKSPLRQSVLYAIAPSFTA